MDYANCSQEPLEDGGFLLTDVQTRAGKILSVYLGPGAVFAILPEASDPAIMYSFLREHLSAVRVCLYVDRLGYFDPYSAALSDPCDAEALQEEIYKRLYQAPQVYTSSALERMKANLIRSDAAQRGYYRDDTGILYFLRGETFRRASEKDSEHIFRLCLFGGVFGLHRFATGRWFTGLVYLLTCGVFLVGWLTDLLQLFMGTAKDKHGFLICPLQDKSKKLLVLPIGIIIAVVALMAYLRFNPVSFLTPNTGLSRLFNQNFGDILTHLA